MPDHIPIIDSTLIKNLDTCSPHHICTEILKAFFYPDLDISTLSKVVKYSMTFDTPLHRLKDDDYILELFHGPTMAFKDVGARVMAQLYKHLFPTMPYRVVVATSGDTGAAVADAFSASGTKVDIFYPNTGVSYFQELQITKFGGNVRAFAVNGTFDECQAIVKYLLTHNTNYVSANSINIARLIPQIFYYFTSYASLLKLYGGTLTKRVVYSIPSGNLGNATACLIARMMGLPIDEVVVACNSNNTFTKYLDTGIHPEYQKTVNTLSNAMDVGSPNNFPRITHLHTHRELSSFVKSVSIDDEQTVNTIHKLYNDNNYTMDPHTAVAYSAKSIIYPTAAECIHVTLSTASPLKFRKFIENVDPGTDDPIKGIVSYKITYNDHTPAIYEKLCKANTLVLIGMPGSGKTTIAQLMGTAWRVVDTDSLIEKHRGRKLSGLLGEDFVSTEKNIIMNNLKIDNRYYNIVSTGGSVVYSPELMSYLRLLGVVVFLTTDYEDIEARVDSASIERGIFMNGCESLKELYDERLPLYRKYSDIAVDTSHLQPHSVCGVLKSLLS
jgi:threonine synthase